MMARTSSPKQRFHKSGTPITTVRNPWAGIMKGPTARLKPLGVEKLKKTGNFWKDFDPNDPYRDYDPENPPIPCPCNYGFMHTNFDHHKKCYEPAPLNENPNNPAPVEQYLASMTQTVLMIKRMHVIQPIYNPPPMSSQLPSGKQSKRLRDALEKNKVGILDPVPPEVQGDYPNDGFSGPPPPAREIKHSLGSKDMESSQANNTTEGNYQKAADGKTNPDFSPHSYSSATPSQDSGSYPRGSVSQSPEQHPRASLDQSSDQNLHGSLSQILDQNPHESLNHSLDQIPLSSPSQSPDQNLHGSLSQSPDENSNESLSQNLDQSPRGSLSQDSEQNPRGSLSLNLDQNQQRSMSHSSLQMVEHRNPEEVSMSSLPDSSQPDELSE